MCMRGKIGWWTAPSGKVRKMKWLPALIVHAASVAPVAAQFVAMDTMSLHRLPPSRVAISLSVRRRTRASSDCGDDAGFAAGLCADMEIGPEPWKRARHRDRVSYRFDSDRTRSVHFGPHGC